VRPESLMPIRALILHANGTNRDREAAQALQMAGALPEIVHLNQLRAGARRWDAFQLLVVPGGFSYADALGAGKLLALDLQAYFADEVSAFVASGRPVIGICNGFQALVKAGLLPGGTGPGATATLTFNAAGRFECRWVSLLAPGSRSVWTRDLPEAIYCPVAHGEGNFVAAEPQVIEQLRRSGRIALVYAGPEGAPADGAYPYNPNGSAADIAGICNEAGNVLGLMPHPEDHLFDYQHPRWTRGETAGLGLPLFANGVRYAKGL
jgi:phosphoribosylformylglycinamidine synthase subunit PurQ / glutaminase